MSIEPTSVTFSTPYSSVSRSNLPPSERCASTAGIETGKDGWKSIHRLAFFTSTHVVAYHTLCMSALFKVSTIMHQKALCAYKCSDKALEFIMNYR